MTQPTGQVRGVFSNSVGGSSRVGSEGVRNLTGRARSGHNYNRRLSITRWLGSPLLLLLLLLFSHELA